MLTGPILTQIPPPPAVEIVLCILRTCLQGNRIEVRKKTADSAPKLPLSDCGSIEVTADRITCMPHAWTK